MRRKHQLQALSIGWAVSVALSSSTVSSSHSRGGSTATAQEDSFKQNDDWWKDPFAMFDQEENEEEEPPRPKRTSQPAAVATPEDAFDDGLLLMDEVDVPLRPARKATRPFGLGRKDRTTKASKRKSSWGRETGPASSRGSFGAPLALLLPMIPKVRSVLAYVPLGKIVASFAFVKALQPVFQRRIEAFKREKANRVENRASRASREEHNADPRDDYYDHDDDDTEEDGQDVKPIRTVREIKPSESYGWLPWLFRGAGQTARIPPRRELMARLQEIQNQLAIIKDEKEVVEREYEKASWQLQETENELANLQSSTQYLKNQLRDNQEVMDRAIRAERQKAREELMKMKEAMLQVLQRERKQLRTKMVQQTAELKAMLKNAGSNETRKVSS